MAYERETVAIRRASGKRSVIAREDYDPAVHTLLSDPLSVAPSVASVPEDIPEAAAEKKRGTWGGKRVKRG